MSVANPQDDIDVEPAAVARWLAEDPSLQLVDVREGELRPAPRGTKRQASHAAKAVDAHPCAHRAWVRVTTHPRPQATRCRRSLCLCYYIDRHEC